MNRFLLFIVAGLLAYGSAGLFAETRADQIVRASLDRKTPGDTISTSTMTITDRSGVARVRKLKTVSKETPEGTRAYIEFIEPADVNGTKFLTVSKQGAETDQRLYLPALKKVRKISSSSKDAEFLGSDLCYFDMEKRYFEDGTYTLLSESETLPEPAFSRNDIREDRHGIQDSQCPLFQDHHVDQSGRQHPLQDRVLRQERRCAAQDHHHRRSEDHQGLRHDDQDDYRQPQEGLHDNTVPR